MTAGMLAAGFVFGLGFGYFVQRAGLCFAHGLGELFLIDSGFLAAARELGGDGRHTDGERDPRAGTKGGRATTIGHAGILENRHDLIKARL